MYPLASKLKLGLCLLWFQALRSLYFMAIFVISMKFAHSETALVVSHDSVFVRIFFFHKFRMHLNYLNNNSNYLHLHFNSIFIAPTAFVVCFGHQTIQTLDEEKNKLDAFCEQSLKNVSISFCFIANLFHQIYYFHRGAPLCV